MSELSTPTSEEAHQILADKRQDHHDEQPTAWQLGMVVLSIFAIALLAFQVLGRPQGEVKRILNWVDLGVCIVFMGDFSVRFAYAKQRLHFVKRNWIDLAASIPNVDALRAARLFRVLRVIRAVRSARYLAAYFRRGKAENTLISVALLAFTLVLGGAVAVLDAEEVPHGNIKTAGDALWWAFTTVTTVGYGDRFPVTFEGRMIAIILMTVGVGLFGTFTAYVASRFVDRAPQVSDAAIYEELQQLRKHLAEHDEVRAMREELRMLREMIASGVQLQPVAQKTDLQ